MEELLSKGMQKAEQVLLFIWTISPIMLLDFALVNVSKMIYLRLYFLDVQLGD